MLAALLPLCDEVVVTSNANPRAVPADDARVARRAAPTHVEGDPRRAIELAKGLAGEDGVVLATGSIYLIADLLRPPGTRGATF